MSLNGLRMSILLPGGNLCSFASIATRSPSTTMTSRGLSSASSTERFGSTMRSFFEWAHRTWPKPHYTVQLDPAQITTTPGPWVPPASAPSRADKQNLPDPIRGCIQAKCQLARAQPRRGLARRDAAGRRSWALIPAAAEQPDLKFHVHPHAARATRLRARKPNPHESGPPSARTRRRNHPARTYGLMGAPM